MIPGSSSEDSCVLLLGFSEVEDCDPIQSGDDAFDNNFEQPNGATSVDGNESANDAELLLHMNLKMLRN